MSPLIGEAQALLALGDVDGCAALLVARADDILGAGDAAALLDLVDAVPPDAVTPALRLVRADALRIAGRVTEAGRAFAPLTAEADRVGRWDPGLAWRAAMVHYMRADFRGALDLLDRPGPVRDRPRPDDVHHASHRACTLMQLGRADEARVLAERTVAAAHVVGDDRAVASAHIAAALCSSGSALDEHLARALEAARRAGDIGLQVRVLNNQADRQLREADYPKALEVAEQAIAAATRGAPPGVRANATYNAGEALLRIGRYDEAVARFEACLRICHDAGLRRTAMPLYGLAEAHRVRGQHERSRAAYEEAVEAARATDEAQVVMSVLAGLARLLLEIPVPDLVAARSAADQARAVAPEIYAAAAIATQGWVDLAAGDLAAARLRGTEAVAAARAGRQADALAEALELTAATAEVEPARAALNEARCIWERAGARPAVDRVLVRVGRLAGADAEARAAGRTASARLRVLGVSAEPSVLGARPLAIRVLGRFEVVAGGRPVPLKAWRSRQARTLVKILVARRGRPVSRVELSDVLWPDDRPERTAHRLSVLLSVVRAVLDPDRRWPADHHIGADTAGLFLHTARVRVDVEDLLLDAADGLALLRAGRTAVARDVLAEVDSAYRGDAFDDEPYADWAIGLREEARAAWLRSLRELADLQRRADEPDQAATSLARLLGADEFDERAHRALVETLQGAGRHGEARRAFQRWTAAMAAIDVPLPQRTR
jgi:DNA-binding SARP family transcriptional activator